MMRAATAITRALASSVYELDIPDSLVMTPTVLGAERLRAGDPQFGWLKTLSQYQSRRCFGIRGFSEMVIDFSWAGCLCFSPGPTTVSRAEFPSLPLPAGGAAKAAVLNHCWIVWGPLLGLPTKSGRMVIKAGLAVPVKYVPVGSGTVIVGVRNRPVLKKLATVNCHPPTILSSAFETCGSNRCPWPKGKA